MKKIPFKIQLLAVMFVIGAAFFGFQAQVRSAADNKEQPAQAQSFNMAVVDVQALLTKSAAAKSISEQLNKQREEFKKEISAIDKKLKDQQQALVKSNGKGTEEEFNKKKAEFEKAVAEGRQTIQKRRNALDTAANTAVEKLRSEITKIVANLSDKNKFDIVISRQNVVLAVKSMDITEEVMTELNSSVTKIDLKVETN